MPSSTSSSERLTAADRPGVAQPVPERPLPPRPWRAMGTMVILLVVLAISAWEWRMRELGLRAGDFDDGASLWAEQRRRVDAEATPVVLLGDSRLLFDTDLARFQTLTGVRPLQLALAGTNARPFLRNLADDPAFHGLALVGIKELSYFRDGIGLSGDALERFRYESPAQHISFVLHGGLSRCLAFLDEEYRLSKLLLRLDPGLRPGAQSPYGDVWKLRSTEMDRQTRMWSRVASDALLNAHARSVWMRRPAAQISDALIARTVQETREAVAAIRARGGEVVFLRPPSAGELRKKEEAELPRQRGWDALLRGAQVSGIHADDDPPQSGLDLPELSHLSAACATVYTDAYVRAVTRVTERLALRADAPAPLTAADCVATAR
ncbi:MAG: hypothetical protein ABI411_02895 [Tahibacter sp.]